MWGGFLFSLALHVGVVAAVLIGLPRFGEQLELGDGITVEIVAVTELETLQLETPAAASPLPERQATRTPDPVPPDTEPTPQPPGETQAPTPPAAPATVPEPAEAAAVPEQAPPTPEPTPARETPAEQETQTAIPQPAPEPETPDPALAPPAFETVEPAPEVEPEVATAPAPETQQAESVDETAPAAPPRRRPPGRPQPSPDQTQQAKVEEDPFDALLQSVEQLDRRVQDETEREGTGTGDAPSTGPVAGGMTDAALQRLIASQFGNCWNVPAGVEGARNIGSVRLITRHARDGQLVSVEVSDRARYSSDPTFRAVADAAVRAVERCSPLRSMPAEDYDRWGYLDFDFQTTGLRAGG